MEFRTGWKWVSLPSPLELKWRSGPLRNPGIGHFFAHFGTKEIPGVRGFFYENCAIEFDGEMNSVRREIDSILPHPAMERVSAPSEMPSPSFPCAFRAKGIALRNRIHPFSPLRKGPLGGR